MSESRREAGSGSRDASGRAADHAGIGQLTDGLLPALIAKLSNSQLGELEVSEGEWRVRLRRSATPEPAAERRTAGRAGRTSAGQDGHGHSRSAGEGKPAPREGDPATNGAGGPSGGGQRAPSRATATSPAVGVFQPGPRATPGTSIRTGDRLGVVDLLGVPQDVVSPVDGVIGATLVESGTAVEYGQDLVRIELAVRSEAS